MAFTYSTDTEIGQVRLLIPDTNEEHALFTDEDIQGFLDLPGIVNRGAGRIYRAAAQACKVLGRGDGLLIQKVQETRGVKTNGAALAAEFRAQANSLLGDAKEAEQNAEEEDSGGFSAVAITRTDFQRRSSATECEE